MPCWSSSSTAWTACRWRSSSRVARRCAVAATYCATAGGLDDPSTRTLLREVVDVGRSLDDLTMLASALSNLAEYDLRAGEQQQAAAHQRGRCVSGRSSAYPC